jgi:hypothetical protein
MSVYLQYLQIACYRFNVLFIYFTVLIQRIELLKKDVLETGRKKNNIEKMPTKNSSLKKYFARTNSASSPGGTDAVQ